MRTRAASIPYVRMEIREVRPSEYDAVGELTARAYLEFLPDEPTEGWNEYLESLRNVAGRAVKTVVLVAVDGGRPVGTATIEMDDVLGDDDTELPPATASLRMLGVDPAGRRKGVGRALVEETIARARQAGKRTLILRTTSLMHAAQRLYRDVGFVRDPALDQHYPDVDLIGYRLEL
jgi:ribosomal protein S18 acetylase RimI-like enzyme